jgi:N-acetylmuramoyl-L-alanine amidase
VVKKEEVSVVEPKKETAEIKNIPSKSGIVFKVQIAASSTRLNPTSDNFKGLNVISREEIGKIYKYYYGDEPTYNDAQDRLKEAKQVGYPSAFIVAYKDGVKIDITDALK